MTIAHGLCGYVAVALLAGRFQSGPRGGGVTIADLRVVAALVAAGSVLDLADGPVARRFGSSGMGERLDAICDTVTFGLAPAVVVAASGAGEGGVRNLALITVGGIYFVAMILRLVRSWLTPSEALSNGFQGMPSAPASSAILATVGLRASAFVTGMLVVLIALLLVGNFHYPRQRLNLMPLMAGGPVIGLLGLWGVLPLEPAMVTTIILAIAPASAVAVAAWLRRDLPSIPPGGAEVSAGAIGLDTAPPS
jgi:CDP-diacylglycerol---serine O-phosphatidyltransferase